jgi:hypothetical protein
MRSRQTYSLVLQEVRVLQQIGVMMMVALLPSAIVAASQDPGFSGEWQQVSGEELVGGQGARSRRWGPQISVRHDGDVLVVDHGRVSGASRHILDGRERTTALDQERCHGQVFRSRASQQGTQISISEALRTRTGCVHTGPAINLADDEGLVGQVLAPAALPPPTRHGSASVQTTLTIEGDVLVVEVMSGGPDGEMSTSTRTYRRAR